MSTCKSGGLNVFIPGLSVLGNSGASQRATPAFRLDSIGFAQISSTEAAQAGSSAGTTL